MRLQTTPDDEVSSMSFQYDFRLSWPIETHNRLRKRFAMRTMLFVLVSLTFDHHRIGEMIFKHPSNDSKVR